MMAQIPTPSVPDNGPTPVTPFGTPPGSSSQGTSESVDFATGAINLYIPLISFPQRGGATLNLGYISHSNEDALQQTMTLSTSNVSENRVNYFVDYIAYNDRLGPVEPPLLINVPRLRFDSEWLGDKYVNGEPTSIYCLANYTFFDWQGNGHPFENINDCTNDQRPQNASITNISDSSDGSGYRLDTTNLNAPVVASSNGTLYAFSNSIQGAPTAPNQLPGDDPVSTVTDPNGNQIQVKDISAVSGAAQTYQITDTIGRVITAGPNGVAYTDSNGTPQNITVSTSASSDTVPYYPALSCTYTGPPQALPYPNPTVTSPTESGGNVPAYTTTTISLPATSGGTRAYTLTFDPYSRMTKIVYLAGGYTRYDYSDLTQTENSPYHATMVDGNVTCNLNLNEVAHKYACPSSTGTCSAEQVTTYPPPAIAYTNTGNPYNSSMSAVDPLGQTETHTFGLTSTVRTNPQETGILKYDATGALIQTVSKSYPPPPNTSFYGENIVYPSTVTTTLNNVSPTLTATVNYQYQQLSEDIGANGNPYTIPTGRPTETDEYGYTGALARKTVQTYYPSSYFAAAGRILDHLNVSTVSGSGSQTQTTTYGDDTLGNITSVTSSGYNAGSLATQYGRNSYGELTSITDPLNHKTTYTYTDNWSSPSQNCVPANSSAYPTSVTDAANHVTSISYNACTGTVASTTDANGAVTSYSYDAAARVTASKAVDASGRVEASSSASYQDAAPLQVTNNQQQSSTVSIVNVTTMDGYGRKLQTKLSSDPSGPDYVDYGYDSLGRLSSVSNPYRTSKDPTYGVTGYQYDVFNRKIVETESDGTSTKTWCYDGSSLIRGLFCSTELSKTNPTAEWVDSTDENGNHHQNVSDFLGRLVAVMEPDPTSGNYALETDYQYDVLGNLTQADQWGGAAGASSGDRQRTFVYDGLSRLTSSTNPESGTIGYVYDNDGNVQTRTDARGVATSYSYDGLNRLTGKTYNDGTLPVHYAYDENSASVHPGGDYGFGASALANGIGRLTSEYVGNTSPGVARKILSYDAMGRTLNDRQCWDTLCSQTPRVRDNWHQYDLAGNVTYLNDSASQGHNFSYDGARRVTAITTVHDGSSQITSLVRNVQYDPVGPMQATLGAGQVETWNRNSRLRISSYQRTNPANSAQVDYAYTPFYQPNGNVYQATETWQGGGGTWSYGYDYLNRLKSVQQPALSEACAYGYDQFGNRQSESPAGAAGSQCFSSSANFDMNNHVAGWCYDASGNLLDDGACPSAGAAHKYSYDGEDRLASAQYGQTRYTYDAEGNRVGTTTSDDTVTDVVFDDVTHQPVAHYLNHENTGQNQDLWFNGEHLGFLVVNASGNQTLTWSATDWLGSERLRTDSAGNRLGLYTSLPFGEGLTTLAGTDADLTHFTGKERDRVGTDVGAGGSGLDYFGARYYSSAMGRFMTPDWSAKQEPVPYSKLDDPQTLNLYSYVGNNPLSRADKDGHCFPFCLALAGGGVLAEEAPLAFTGPVGWTVIGVTAVSVAGVEAYQYFHQDAAATPAPAAPTGATPVPSGLVGTDQSPKSGKVNSGPLAPENGGTGDAGKDFGTLTGGKSGPAPDGKGYPAGTQVGENGVQLRPGTATAGPRIDIPANGPKPNEVLHYPAPPPPPPPNPETGTP